MVTTKPQYYLTYQFFILTIACAGMACVTWLAKDMDGKHQLVLWGAVCSPMVAFYLGMKRWYHAK